MQDTISKWLSDICQRERLSLREAAAKTGLSHATIKDILGGDTHPNPETIKKLARAFAEGGTNEYLALEDYLLVLAGYRTGRLQGETTQPMARLLDKLDELNEREVEIMARFAEFLIQLREA